MALSLRKKYASHNPPIAIGTTMSSQVRLKVTEKLGPTIQNKSTYRISKSHAASQTRRVISRLKGREIRNTNGTAKWNRTRNRPTYPQPPCRRRVYQVISSGKFPAQMMSHWEKAK